jgi:hypothetical protein
MMTDPSMRCMSGLVSNIKMDFLSLPVSAFFFGQTDNERKSTLFVVLSLNGSTQEWLATTGVITKLSRIVIGRNNLNPFTSFIFQNLGQDPVGLSTNENQVCWHHRLWISFFFITSSSLFCHLVQWLDRVSKPNRLSTIESPRKGWEHLCSEHKRFL